MLKSEGVGEFSREGAHSLPNPNLLDFKEEDTVGSHLGRMVTITQHSGTFAFWQQNNHLFSYGSVVPCQWHSMQPTVAATSNCFSVKQHSIRNCLPYVSPPPVQLDPTINTSPHPYNHLGPPTISPVTASASMIDPKKPIGYGSFGVVW